MEGLEKKVDALGFDDDDKPQLDFDDIDADDPLVKEYYQIFICNICTFVVTDPNECKQCNRLFCKECITGWKNK